MLYLCLFYFQFSGQQSIPTRPPTEHSQNLNQVPNTNSSHPSVDGSATPPSRPPMAPTTPSPSSIMAAQGSYQAQPPPHMHGYKMGPNPTGPQGGPVPQNMPPYGSPQSQYSQGKQKE